MIYIPISWQQSTPASNGKVFRDCDVHGYYITSVLKNVCNKTEHFERMRRTVTLPISAHLICTSAMQFALLFVRFHEVLHKLQRHLPIFQLWTTILPLNHWNTQLLVYTHRHNGHTNMNTCVSDPLQLPMFSKLIESAMLLFVSSTRMALSNAICFTILLHSAYFILASLSFGFALVTCNSVMKVHITNFAEWFDCVPAYLLITRKHLQYTVQLGSPTGNPPVCIMKPTATFVNHVYNIKMTIIFAVGYTTYGYFFTCSPQ